MTTTTAARLELGGDYALRWADFIGQEMAKAQLLTAARSAKLRKEPMPHTLIADGAPGVGKTNLAVLTALEMKSRIKVASGKIRGGQARLLMSDMKDGDVLIIDEAHLLVHGGKREAEWLLNYLQDGVLVTPIGPQGMPKVTIIAATTDAGLLPETILDRFTVKPTLVAYSPEEGTQIARALAKRVFEGKGLGQADCARVAAAASNNPRVMRQILCTVRDVMVVHELPAKRALTRALEWLGLTEDGLNATARQYLTAMVTDFNGEPAGERGHAGRLQQPGGLRYVERTLMEKGYVAKTGRGRMLTAAGIARAKELLAHPARTDREDCHATP